MNIRRVPMYRRSQSPHQNGLRERAFWLLSKNGPMTGNQLCDALNVPRHKLFSSIRESADSEGVARVSVRKLPCGDRLYTLNGKVRLVKAKVSAAKQIIISERGGPRSEEARELAEQAAQRRRRLIAAGLYITESDLQAMPDGSGK